MQCPYICLYEYGMKPFMANLCRGAASFDAQEADSHEHHHPERHTGHQLSDVHLGSAPEQEEVVYLGVCLDENSHHSSRCPRRLAEDDEQYIPEVF